MDDSQLTEKELAEAFKVIPVDKDATPDPSNFDVELNKPFSLGSQNSLYSVLAKGDSPTNELNFNIKDHAFEQSFLSEGQQAVERHFINFDPMNLAKQDIKLIDDCISILNGAGTVCAGAGINLATVETDIKAAAIDHGLGSTRDKPDELAAGVAFKITF